MQCVCDIPNGLISWIVDDETKQVIAEAQIIPQFKGKEMIPYIGLEDVGDIVEILAWLFITVESKFQGFLSKLFWKVLILTSRIIIKILA